MATKPPESHHDDAESTETPPPRKAGLLQVAKTVFFGMLMIGAKGTWEKDGAQVTPVQIVVGGIIGAIVLVVCLLVLVRLVIRLAAA